MGDILFGLLAVVLGAAATYGLYWVLNKLINLLPAKFANKFKSAAFLLPAAVLVILILVMPMFQTIIWSFMNDDGKKFVGIENYAELFGSAEFISILINFVILAFVIFLMVKQINRLKRETPPAPEAPAATPEDVLLLREIRDSLRK